MGLDDSLSEKLGDQFDDIFPDPEEEQLVRGRHPPPKSPPPPVPEGEGFIFPSYPPPKFPPPPVPQAGGRFAGAVQAGIGASPKINSNTATKHDNDAPKARGPNHP